MAITPGRKLYEDQIGYIMSNDIDSLINNYTEDAEIISLAREPFSVKGREALKEHFHNYLKMLGNLRIKSTDKFIETENSILFEATTTSDLGEARVYDAFALRDGKIYLHFSGLLK